MVLRKPAHMSWPRFWLGLFVPHSIAMMIGDVLRQRDQRLDRYVEQSLRLKREHEAGRDEQVYSFEAAVGHLISRGLPEEQVRGGSMPEASLVSCTSVLRERLDVTQPISILHVGNFVGVSLSWFADLARTWSHGSRVVGIDPNVRHRGIERPQEQVLSLLTEFGLESLVLLLTGYTLRKNAGDLDPDDPRGSFARDQSCENALPNLAALISGQIDVALLDGNHDLEYLHGELEQVRMLLRPGGLLVLDDVFDWHNLTPIAQELNDAPDTTLILQDERFGIWQLT